MPSPITTTEPVDAGSATALSTLLDSMIEDFHAGKVRTCVVIWKTDKNKTDPEIKYYHNFGKSAKRHSTIVKRVLDLLDRASGLVEESV